MSDNEAEVNYNERERSRSRDRSFDREYRDEENRHHDAYPPQQQPEDDGENFNMYITNINLQTTEETLRAAFERIGEVASASIVREPVTKVSRGFGFLEMMKREDSLAAIETLNGADLEGNKIRVERARRRGGYGKSPGVYLGPPQFSSKYCRERRERERGGGGGSRMDSRGDRGSGGMRGDMGGLGIAPGLRGGSDRLDHRLDHRRGGGGGGGGYVRDPLPPSERYLPRDFYAREDERLAALSAYGRGGALPGAGVGGVGGVGGPMDLYGAGAYATGGERGGGPMALYREDPRFVDPRFLDVRYLDSRLDLPPPRDAYFRGGAGGGGAGGLPGRRSRSPLGRGVPVGYERLPPPSARGEYYHRRSPSPSGPGGPPRRF